ncbi:hypothetical protein SUGI_1148020 [Cryptomeria japonica]|nr:hypothetical protein SUGI_1148020 [Cryptomeria japonica]
MYIDQFNYCDKKANLTVGNVLPLISIPEDVVVCNMEQHVSNCGFLAKASRYYAIVISHNLDSSTSSGRIHKFLLFIQCSKGRRLIRSVRDMLFLYMRYL